MKAAGRALVALVSLLVALADGAPAGAEEETPFGVVDLHVDVPWQVHFKGRGHELSEGHVTPEGLRKGRYAGIVLAIYLPDYLHEDGAHIEDAEAVLATIEKVVQKSDVLLPLDARVARPGRVTTFVAIEGAGAFAKDITAIDAFIARGVRMVGLVHAKNGPLASAATGERVPHGLTEVGRRFVARVYEKGAIVDVSHMSDKAFDDLVPIARAHGAPIVATHSNARALAGHARTLTDDQLRAIGASGGVAGVNFHAPFVSRKADATLADVVRQVEHMVKVAGVDAVAIGSDFDGGIKVPKGLEDASRLPALARALRARGLTEGDVLKIFGLNALRVLAWRFTPRAGTD